MTDRRAGRLSANQELQLGSLMPESYTANRLNNANPEHLYITSRRCFIGPIPEGWLNSHRKDWYKHHLSLNYSSRTAVFTAKDKVSTQRRVSGLNGASGSAIPQSFPQPEDLRENSRQEREREGDGSPEDVQTEDAGVDREDDMNSAIDEAAPLDETEGDDDRTTHGKDTTKKPPAFGISVPTMVGQVETPDLGSAKRSGSSERNRSVLESNLGLVSFTLSERPGPATSKTSLLREEPSNPVQEQQPENPNSTRSGVLSRVTRAVSRPQVDLGAAPENSDDLTAPKPRRSHIRFDILDESSPTALLARARMTQLQLGTKLKDVFKRELQDGQILKMGKMLVRVDSTPETKLPGDYDENGNQGIVSKTEAKWREYMVVCRQSEKVADTKVVLQIYKTRVIPAFDSLKSSKRPKYEIPLSEKRSRVNMYSSLDKSLVTWTPDGHGTKIFLFQACSSSSSAEWYTFLRGILGENRASELRINVPELNVNLRLENPFDILNEDDDEEDQDDEQYAQRTLEKAHAVAPNIIKTCLEMLEAAPEWSDALQKWMDHRRIGLAWKRYDRLEWIHGANEKKMCGTIAMIQSHDLELRPKQHYATTSHTRKGKVLTEPAPVEGFLVRLTSQKGKHQRMGKLFFKRLYFSTSDHYLFFSRPKNADPPSPPRLPSSVRGSTPSSRTISDQIPIIYAVNPYPIKDGEIEWMDSPFQVVERHDRDAYNEMVRKVNTIENCDGFIDLCDVVKVRKVHRGAAEADDLIDDDSEMDTDADDSDGTEEDGQTNRLDDERTFELKLKNGLVIRLQAYDKQTRKEWKSRLRELIRYWKKRHAQDILLYKEIRTQNLQELQVDEEGEAILGQFAKKWELGLTHASPELYNMCGISCCRTIHMSGPLYRKPRLHGTFMSVQCVLIPGSLLLFETALRTRTGKAVLHIHHSKIQKIDLANCYLYSGLLTEGDLLYQNRTFDSNSPGHHALPRMWPEDGWNSRDEDVMTCFVLWRPSGKSWFRAPGEGKAARLKRVSALGRKGNRIVFRARSRAERDHWVLAIAAEIERSLGKEEVRIESQES